MADVITNTDGAQALQGAGAAALDQRGNAWASKQSDADKITADDIEQDNLDPAEVAAQGALAVAEPDAPVVPPAPPAAAPPAASPDASSAVVPAVHTLTTPTATGSSAATAQAILEAKTAAGEVVPIPADVLIPLKRGDTVEMVKLSDLQKQGMMERDYRIKTGETAEHNRQLAIRDAKLAAREQWVSEQEKLAREAQTDPQKMAEFEQHFTLMKTNEMYRANVEAALAQRETKAELEAIQADQQRQIVMETAAYLDAEIDRQASQYPGIDPELVRATYKQGLIAETMPIDVRVIGHLYQQEAAKRSAYVQPLQSELDAMKAQIAALTAASAGAAHNDKVKTNITRSQTTITVPAGGAPPGPPPREAPKPYVARDAEARRTEWARVRD